MPTSRSLRSQSSAAHLGRNHAPPPSTSSSTAPYSANTTYPLEHPGASFHSLARVHSVNSSSQSSLSPNVTPTELTPGSSFVFVGNGGGGGGASSDSFPSFDSSAYSSTSSRHPQPPPLKHSATDPRMLTPSLRQSASFSNGDRGPSGGGGAGPVITPTRSETGSTTASSSSKRHSDESGTSASFRKSSRWSTKKKGLPGFIDSVLGSPRKIEISAPENPIHLTHVGYDNETGQFTVRSPPTCTARDAVAFLRAFLESRMSSITQRHLCPPVAL